MNKVSVVLPAYNAEKNIENTIKSILKQDYKNFELIIINDGSRDRTHEICKKMFEDNSKIRYFEKENSGVSDTRNFGISVANGKYIMFIDSDDEYKEEMISKMVKQIEKNKSDLVVCGYEMIYQNHKAYRNFKINSLKKYKRNEFDILVETCQRTDLFNQVWNKLFIKEIIEQNNLKFEKQISLGEDYRFVIEYLKYINLVTIIPDVLYKYNQIYGGLNTKYRPNKLQILIDNELKLKQFFEQNKFSMNYYNKRYIRACMSGIKNIALSKTKEDIEKKCNEYTNDIEIHKELKNIFNNTNNILQKIMIVSLTFRNVKYIKFLARVLKVICSYKR